jgi:hypothetical protein
MGTAIAGTLKTQTLDQCIPTSYSSLGLPVRAIITSLESILLSKRYRAYTPTRTLQDIVSHSHRARILGRRCSFPELSAEEATPPRTRDGTTATRSNLSDYRNITTANGTAL